MYVFECIYACVCSCMCACVCLLSYVHTHICRPPCMFVPAYMCVRMYLSVYTCMCASMHMCAHVYMQAYVYLDVCAYAYVHTNAHVPTFMLANMCVPVEPWKSVSSRRRSKLVRSASDAGVALAKPHQTLASMAVPWEYFPGAGLFSDRKQNCSSHMQGACLYQEH